MGLTDVSQVLTRYEHAVECKRNCVDIICRLSTVHERHSLKAATHTGELVGNQFPTQVTNPKKLRTSCETSSQLVRNPGFQLVSN